MTGKRVTVNLSVRATEALQLAQKRTGEDITSVLNSAVRLYATVLEPPEGQLYVLRDSDVGFERIHLP